MPIQIDKIIRLAPQGLTGAAGPTTTAALIAALAAGPPNNAQKLALATALGFPIYASRLLANAGLVTGTPFFNSTTYLYDVTSA